jgi:HPt (histidine-containing phosphotransfer) domain-containing protein
MMPTDEPRSDSTGRDADFDLEAWRAIAELDPTGETGLVAELTDTFIRDAGEKLGELRGHLAAGDAAGVHRLTHQLKSSAATLGLMRMSRISREIDEDARRGGLDAATRLIDALETAFASGSAWLRARAPQR